MGCRQKCKRVALIEKQLGLDTEYLPIYRIRAEDIYNADLGSGTSSVRNFGNRYSYVACEGSSGDLAKFRLFSQAKGTGNAICFLSATISHQVVY